MAGFPRHYSLSLKIVAVFATATIALLMALWLMLQLTFNRFLSNNFRPFANDLITLQQQIGFPPDMAVAKQLAQQYPIIIQIDAPDYHWSSQPDVGAIEKLEVSLNQFDQEGVISETGFYQGQLILRSFQPPYLVSLLTTEKVDNPSIKRAMWLTLGVIVLIVGGLFAVVASLFQPVKTIERGVKRIGNGEVSHRLTVKHKDEIGSLASSINKMADNIEQMLDAKRQLLLAISHELRTPITRSKLGLSMLENGEVKESIVEDMNEMEALIEELLESERISGNHAPLNRGLVNVNDLIYQVQGRFFEHAPLIMNMDYDLPELYIDPSRIGLAVKNVIKNALTASLSPTDKVIVSTSVTNQQVTISVSDSGTGIAAEEIPRLTEPFYRPDSSRQRKTGGFGIGLHLVKTIVSAHGGHLLIDSDMGRGTTVTLSLPLSRATSKAARGASDS